MSQRVLERHRHQSGEVLKHIAIDYRSWVWHVTSGMRRMYEEASKQYETSGSRSAVTSNLAHCRPDVNPSSPNTRGAAFGVRCSSRKRSHENRKSMLTQACTHRGISLCSIISSASRLWRNTRCKHAPTEVKGVTSLEQRVNRYKFPGRDMCWGVQPKDTLQL